jgi:hypothetical protein
MKNPLRGSTGHDWLYYAMGAGALWYIWKPDKATAEAKAAALPPGASAPPAEPPAFTTGVVNIAPGQTWRLVMNLVGTTATDDKIAAMTRAMSSEGNVVVSAAPNTARDALTMVVKFVRPDSVVLGRFVSVPTDPTKGWTYTAATEIG